VGVRTRVKGRFASEGEAGDEAQRPLQEKARGRPLRPKQCRSFAQRQIAEAFPEIVERFVREAKQGSIPHAKALTELSGLDRREAGAKKVQVTLRQGRQPSLTEMLMQELKRGRDADPESSTNV